MSENLTHGSHKYIYAIGRVEPRFPNQSLEKEFYQVRGRSDTAGLTDRQIVHSILSKRENRYIARQMCWVFTIEGLDSYVLQPRDPADYELLVQTLRASPGPGDIDVVVGIEGPLAAPDMCNGLLVNTVMFDVLYSFDVNEFINSIPQASTKKDKDEGKLKRAAEELLWRVMQLADNKGSGSANRALNYLTLRYPLIYQLTADRFGSNYSLASVDVRQSRLSNVREVVDVIFAFTNRQTDVAEKYFVRVDVTEEFPFLVTPLSPYYDR